MTPFHNKIIAKQPVFGIASFWAEPGIIEAVGGQFDFVWLDGQHGYWNAGNMVHGVRACEIAGTASLIRLPDHSYGAIGRALDLAATGVILPCVDTPAQARSVVEAAHFPPVGNRSFGGRRVIDLHGRNYAADLAQRPLLITQVESPAAVKAVHELAAVEGVAGLFFGPDDMKLRAGWPMDMPLNAPELGEQARIVSEACRRCGKFSMTVAGTAEALAFALETGFSVIVVAADVQMVKHSTATTIGLIKHALEKKLTR